MDSLDFERLCIKCVVIPIFLVNFNAPMKRNSPIHTDRNPKKKKRPQYRPRWKTSDGWKNYKHQIEKVLKHTLVEDEGMWLKQGYKARSTPPVICGNCGVRNESAMIYSIMNRGQDIGCACRHQSKWRPPAPHSATKDTIVRKETSLSIIPHWTRILSLNVWEVAKMREGTTGRSGRSTNRFE